MSSPKDEKPKTLPPKENVHAADFPAPRKDQTEESKGRYNRLLTSIEALSGRSQDMAAANSDRSKYDFPNAYTPCDEGRLRGCQTGCCKLYFELSKEDLEQGFEYEPNMPYAIRHEADGYCYLLDRKTMQCSVWHDRPKACRVFDCRKKSSFKHLWED